MNYGSEPADQVVRYSLEGAEFALRISGTAAKNFFIFAQAVLHDSKKTHGKTHLIRLLKEQKPLKFFTVDKDRMHDFARAAKAHGLLFCPIRDKMDPDHIEIAILQDDASKANRIIDKLQLAIVDTGTAELIDTVQQERGETAPETERVQTEDGAVDFEVGADEEQFNMGFPQGSENASPSEPFSDSSKSFANSPSPRADQLRAKGERPSVRMELSDITAYLRRKVEPPKDRMPRMPVKIKRKEKTLYGCKGWLLFDRIYELNYAQKWMCYCCCHNGFLLPVPCTISPPSGTRLAARDRSLPVVSLPFPPYL